MVHDFLVSFISRAMAEVVSFHPAFTPLSKRGHLVHLSERFNYLKSQCIVLHTVVAFA